MNYVALLRGINVGGNTKVEMAKLRKVFEELGYKNVKTLLNSGNVVFEALESGNLLQKIEEKLEKTFGFKITVIVRSAAEIKSLVKSDPFKNIDMTPETRLYIIFLSEGGEICSSLILSPERGTVDLMSDIEKSMAKKLPPEIGIRS